MAMNLDAAEAMVDLGRYPLLDLGGAEAARVVADARAALAATGAAELPGFIAPAAVDTLVADAEALAPPSHHSEGLGTAYLDLPDFEMPEDHPRRWFGH